MVKLILLNAFLTHEAFRLQTGKTWAAKVLLRKTCFLPTAAPPHIVLPISPEGRAGDSFPVFKERWPEMS